MLKILILLIIIAGAFWLGRLSAGTNKDKISTTSSKNESEVIDIELEDESKS